MTAQGSSAMLALIIISLWLFCNATTTQPPTSQPSFEFGPVGDAQLLITTFHRGDSCSMTPGGYAIKSFPLNQCTPSNDAKSNYHPYKLSCMMTLPGGNKYTVIKDTYSDFACTRRDARTMVDRIVTHADVCSTSQLDGSPGGYSQVQCAAELDASLWSRDQLLVRSFNKPTCDGGMGKDGSNPETLAIFLNMCVPVTRRNKRGAEYFRKLSYVSGDGVNSQLVLTEQRYGPKDDTCQNPQDSLTILYFAQSGGGCMPDPLHTGRYYTRAARSPNLQQSMPGWLELASAVSSSALKTPQPSPVPTSMPTVEPTALPTSSSPTTPPTASPTRLITRSGLVMMLDAAGYSGSGNWVDSVGGLQFVPGTNKAGSTPPAWNSAGGGSFTFDASKNQFMDSTQPLSSGTLLTWTLELWYFHTSATPTGSYPFLITDLRNDIGGSKSNFWIALWNGNSNDIRYGFNNVAQKMRVGSLSSLFQTNSWHHIVATFDGSYASFYVNNRLINQEAWSTSTAPVGGGLGIRLMRRWDVDTDFWSGSLAVVRIYNRGLSVAEVSKNWEIEATRFFPPTTKNPILIPPTPQSVISNWKSRLVAAGTDASSTVVTAATTFATTLFNSGLHSKISRLNLFSGNDLKAALIPLFYQPSTQGKDTILAGSFSYSLTSGVTTNNDGAYMSSNQKISRVDHNDNSSWPADGSNIHMSMFFMDSPPSCRNMGVFRHAVYSRHYLLSDSGNTGWGSVIGSSSLSAGLYTATSDASKESTIGSSKAVRVKCLSGTCTTVVSGTGDGSTPADWPVGLWACLGSYYGCVKSGDKYYSSGGTLSTCDAGVEDRDSYSICSSSMRVGGYSIGYKLTQAEIQTLSDAWNKYFNDIARV